MATPSGIDEFLKGIQTMATGAQQRDMAAHIEDIKFIMHDCKGLLDDGYDSVDAA